MSIRHSRSPIARPTVPIRSPPGGLTKLPALVSVRPYPSEIGRFAAAKKVGDLRAQRRRAGDQHPDPAAEAGLELAEHQLLGQRVAQLQPGRHRLAGLLQGDLLLADRDGPGEDLRLRAAGVLRGGDRLVVDLLEDPGRAAHQRRPDHRRAGRPACPPGRRRRSAGRRGWRRRAASCRTSATAAATGTAGRRRAAGPTSRLRHALPAPAAVQQLDALGPAGGAGGVDQGGQVVRADAGDQHVDQLRARRPAPARPAPPARRASAAGSRRPGRRRRR